MIAVRWIVWCATLAAVVKLDVPGPEPRVDAAAAIGLALAAAVALFAALARLRVRPLVPRRAHRSAAARLGLHFSARAAYEEAVWRGLVLGPTSGALGAAPGLAVSTLGFAASHVGTQGRRAAAHLLTGATFGSLYLATGHLLAAVLAHAAYDVLVTAAAVADGTWPVRTIGRGRAAAYDRAEEGAR
ncbi:MAG TPA: CPBP family intramembrane glutamic endopeptidase [Gaiellaceae bacterium]|nr:CPBP family intramembrane glutamic endopeptidase [Gaiellaceae bacterium]